MLLNFYALTSWPFLMAQRYCSCCALKRSREEGTLLVAC